MASVSADLSLFIMTTLHSDKDTRQSIWKNLNSYDAVIYCAVLQTITTKAEKLIDLFTDPIFHLLDFLIELEDILGLLQTFSTVARRLEQLIPLQDQTVDTFLDLWRCLMMLLQERLPSLQQYRQPSTTTGWTVLVLRWAELRFYVPTDTAMCSKVQKRSSQSFTYYYYYYHHFTALFPGPPGWAGARRKLLDFLVQGKINGGRHRPSGWAPLHPDQPVLTSLPAAQPTVSKNWSHCLVWY